MVRPSVVRLPARLSAARDKRPGCCTTTFCTVGDPPLREILDLLGSRDDGFDRRAQGGKFARQILADFRCDIEPMRHRSAQEEYTRSEYPDDNRHQNYGAEARRNAATLEVPHHRAQRQCEEKCKRQRQQQVARKIGNARPQHHDDENHRPSYRAGDGAPGARGYPAAKTRRQGLCGLGPCTSPAEVRTLHHPGHQCKIPASPEQGSGYWP